MQVQENISLKPFNTFGIDAKAKYFVRIHSANELQEAINYKPKTKNLILGGGSNILLTKNFDGLVIKNEIKGIELLHEDPDSVYLKAGAGENWHQFVMYCIDHDRAGIENLSLIPGSVGAAPMQNIGAYGVELQSSFWSLEAFHLQEKQIRNFTLSDCEFGYRESVFKKKYKDQFIILSVTFRLNKRPVFHTSYGDIVKELERMQVKDLSIKAISQAVINIRASKLPDPMLIGNAGSFFKNPSVSQKNYEELRSKFENIVAYPNIDGTVKLAAGWLIDQCGPRDAVSWKGYRKNDAGVHAKQALVLVNYGNASGKEIYDLSEEILQSVKKKFGVVLEREVNII